MRIFLVSLFLMLSVSLAVAEATSGRTEASNTQAKAEEIAKASANRMTSPPGSVFFGETLGGSTNVDMVKVKCKGLNPDTISADVASAGPRSDNSFHVTVTCIKPALSHNSDSEATDGGVSSKATVHGCKQALITYTCEINDSCDEFYNSIIDCGANQVKSVTLITDQDFGGGSGVAECNDGLDNDGDTFTDFSATPGVGDPQCACPTYGTEGGGIVTSCGDCIDNDLDGLTDIADPQCASSTDTTESGGSAVECNDGIDNDGDTFIDFNAAPGVGDPQCASPTDSSEAM